MKNSIKYLLLPVCFFTMLATQTIAQSNNTKNDPEAKKILDAVSAKFKTFATVKAGFEYMIENVSGKKTLIIKGSLHMKGTKYKILLGSKEIYSDGSTVWDYDKETNEVTISKLGEAAGTITPQQLFTKFYDNSFWYKLNGEKKSGAKIIQEIELTPKDKSQPYFKIYVSVDKAAKTIYSTKVFDNGGDRHTYTIKTINTKTAMADSLFRFNKANYPGVEEIDLR